MQNVVNVKPQSETNCSAQLPSFQLVCIVPFFSCYLSSCIIQYIVYVNTQIQVLRDTFLYIRSHSKASLGLLVEGIL